MKNKLFAIILTALCFSGLASVVQAQREKSGTSVRFNKTGILVEFKTQTDPPQKNGEQYNVRGSTQIQGEQNVTHRVFVDQKTGAVFGYDLQIEAVEGTNQFKLSFMPLSSKIYTPKTLPVKPARVTPLSVTRISPEQLSEETKQRIVERGMAQGGGNTVAAADEKNVVQESAPVGSNFPGATKYPDSTIINDGATIALDVLVNPQTGVKIVDLITVSSEAKQSAEKNAGEQQTAARDFSPDAIKLSLKNFKVLINGQPFGVAENPAMGSVTGTILWLYLPGRGRFVFSLAPREGFDFEKIGVIEGNKISFTTNSDVYEITSAAPIFGSAAAYGGSIKVAAESWNLWVLRQPDFVPNFTGAQPNSYLFGASDRIENLIKKK